MIKIKVKDKSEVMALRNYLLVNKDSLPITDNMRYNDMLESIFHDILQKLNTKLNSNSEARSFSFKNHEAIAFFTLYADSTFPRPDYTDSNFNIVVQKMNFIHQKIS